MSGYTEYSRRRSIAFNCRPKKPVIKSFTCSNNGCKVRCANDRCKVRPYCLKASTSDVGTGNTASTNSGGQYTGWSTCPSGMSATGLKHMELQGSVEDGRATSLRNIVCHSQKTQP